MKRNLIISNRLPVTVSREEGRLRFQESVGGLSTGLSSLHKESGGLWIGWPGIASDELVEGEKSEIRRILFDRYRCVPVFLSSAEVEMYYLGFSNKTLWPLFHYFIEKVEFNPETWEVYQAVNRRFFEITQEVLLAGDVIWIQDYQLMLLPKLLKDTHPELRIGFFLHIPFPSYEIYRLLIWREDLLHGVLGADLIGFHTYDYVRHFLSSARRILQLDDQFNRIMYEDRYIHVDAFPMGIDYDRFARAPSKRDPQLETIYEEIQSGIHMVLSVDRLDYTKGIPQRIEAYSQFLQNHPEYHGKIRWNLIIAPSRENIESYDLLKKEISEAISKVNGQFGTMEWMPIWFFYRAFSQESLIEFYRTSDIMLVTPLRDGMNLVAKEYLAARKDLKGMLVISETAGAASELSEAVVINAYDPRAVEEGIMEALSIPEEDRMNRNRIMHQRLERYNIDFWGRDFIKSLEDAVNRSDTMDRRIQIEKKNHLIPQAYHRAGRRILFLDYDGTLVGIQSIPKEAKPDARLIQLLTRLVSDPKNTVVVISGRDRKTLDQWLGSIPGLNLVASHGLWLMEAESRSWQLTTSSDTSWMESIRLVLQMYVDRMPGALLEEKDFSLAFHYRRCESDMASRRIPEIKETLMGMAASSSITIQEGKKVLEMKDSRVNKGHTASTLLHRDAYDFVLAAGDDVTDEDLFNALPEESFSIHIGAGPSSAAYSLKSWHSLRRLLEELAGGESRT